MREILFRAKGKVTGEWIMGDLFHHGEQLFIAADNRNTEIIPETLGQYTGLNDANGKKIFEGDICDFTAFRYDGSDRQFRGAVIYDGSRFVLCVSKEKDVLCDLDYVLLNDDELGVIGNIHDNPEKIKAMSVEEMADFIGFFNANEDICNLSNYEMGVDYCSHHNCHDCAMKYLQQESEAKNDEIQK